MNNYRLKAYYFKSGKRIWNKQNKTKNLFVILSQKLFFYGGTPLNLNYYYAKDL